MRGLRREVVRYLELVGLTVLAVAQPVLDVFGSAPEQFVFRGVSERQIVLFAIAVAVVPAAVLWLPGAIVGIRSPEWARRLHLVAVAAAALAGALQILPSVGLDGPAKLVPALAAAAFLVVAHVRYEPVRSWAAVLAIAAPLFVALFLFATPSGDLVFASTPELVDLESTAPRPAEGGADETTAEFPDIVMIVLDELPTSLLLDQQGEIDFVRYPAMAAFAADATWYRTHTTVTSQTVKAIPSLLSGQLPDADDLAVWSQRPDNLFRLLGGTYHLTVSEGLTRLCPRDWCGSSPIPPPGRSTTDDIDPEAPPDAPPPVPEPRRGGFRAVVGDAFGLWTDQVALRRGDEPVVTGFEEDVVEQAPTGTVAATPPTTTADPTRTAEELSTTEAEDLEADVFDGWFSFRNDLASQLPRVEEFRAALRGTSDQPTLYYIHLVLPHQPFIFTETGATYAGTSPGDADRSDWEVAVDTERMSLQMQFTDALVGSLLAETRERGIYDDALVIVTADHGASLAADTEYRWYDGTNAADLLLTPLLIKRPNQSEGETSDARFESIDLLPTIADLLGVAVPWPLDGRSALDPAPAGSNECDDERNFVRFEFGKPVGGAEPDHFELCVADMLADGLTPSLGPLDPADAWATAPLARATPYGDLLGDSWAALPATPGAGTFELIDRHAISAGTSPPAGLIRGTVADDVVDDWVAIGIDGRIAGISPLFTRPDSTRRGFSVLVPSALLSTAGYDITMASLGGVGGELVAEELSPS